MVKYISYLRFFLYLFLVPLSLYPFHSNVYSQEINSTSNSNTKIPNLIYYDADDISINKNTGYLILDGNATFLIGNVYISAQKIVIQKQEGLVTCDGNVQLIYSKEKATASRVILDLITKQVRMDNAVIFSDPTLTNEKADEEIFGLSKAEIAFDQAKNLRSQEIEQQLKELRENYVNLKNLKTLRKNDPDLDLKTSDLLRRYSQLLGRYIRTQYQPNSYLSGLPEKNRIKFMERRNAVEKFNKENPDIVNQITNFTPIPGYIKLSAAQIIQKDKDTFLLKNSFITPCHCSLLGEPPIYGFSSQNAQIEVGDYVTLQGATIDVFTLPVFYIPWMKLPIKNKRSTGFLYPGGYVSSNAGQAISVPFFLVLGDHADSTITYENFSQRGSRFSDELRIQLSEDSQLYTSGQYIEDRLYHDDWLTNSNLIDQNISETTDPNQQQIFANYRGIDRTQRWYTESSLNLPISYFGSIKGNGQFVSDNNYLSDFSPNTNVNPVTAVFGNTTPSSRRFLTQEIDGEYYGNNITLSTKAQGLQDLFATSRSNTPQRMPKVEFSLLPDRYFDLPFVINNNSTWEKVTRLAGPNLISIPPQIPNPYAEGNRLYSTSTVVLPLASNPYVDAYASTQLTAVQYYFPSAAPSGSSSGAFQPYQTYLKHSANLSVPLYGRYDFFDKDNQVTGNITQNFTPFVNLSSIPNVIRETNYPTTYQLWYAQDNVASSAYLTIGANTSWTIQKGKYINSNLRIKRLLQSQDTGVANLSYFSKAIEEKKLKVTADPKELFNFSSEIDAGKIYDSWAQYELNGYYQQVLADELDQNYIWPQGTYYQLSSDLDITPVSISISTNYNFLAQKTADELNSLAGPNFNSPYPVEPYGDINGNLSWNLSPLIPLSGSLNSSYSQAYHRINTAGATVSATLPYGFGASYSHNLQYVISTTDPSIFVLTTQRTASITYTPKQWMQLGFQWAKATDPTTPPTTDMSQGRDYGSSYNINFINLQDCLDLILSRNKPAGIPEGQATYAIGLNLKIFGYSTGYPQIADYLNRSLQKQ
jgi:lipopolysaccharide assembly outer membrane protein LptD (OstA)